MVAGQCTRSADAMTKQNAAIALAALVVALVIMTLTNGW
jgi:hypothetical protein